MRGVWCQAPSAFRPPLSGGGHGIQGWLPLCPGRCGWYRGPRTGPTACALASWRCVLWGWWGVRLGGGGACAVSGGVPGLALVLPQTACPRGSPSGSAALAAGASVRALGPGTVPWVCLPCGVLRSAGVVGGGRPGGWLAAFLRGVWRQAAPLFWPPVPAGGRPGHVAHVSRARVVWPWGTGDRAHSARSCQPVLRAVGVAGGLSWGGAALRRCEGRLRSGARPPPDARHRGRLSGSATHVLWARECGPAGLGLSPWLACPAGGCLPGGLREAVPGVPGLLPLWGAPGVRHCPSPGRPSHGAGVPDPLPRCPGHRWCCHGGPSTRPTARALAIKRCAL